MVPGFQHGGTSYWSWKISCVQCGVKMGGVVKGMTLGVGGEECGVGGEEFGVDGDGACGQKLLTATLTGEVDEPARLCTSGSSYSNDLAAEMGVNATSLDGRG